MTKRDLFATFRAGYQADDAKNGGPRHWRSLEHKAGNPESRDLVEREFQPGASEASGFQRREMLKLAGASMGLAGLAGCVRRPEEEILPYTKMPEDLVPGVAQLYATAMPRPSGALGLLVEAHEGRPTKIEGNPDHPNSAGKSDTWAQATILELYDPNRSQKPFKGDGEVTWADWDTFAKNHFAKYAGTSGKGLAFLLDDSGGPTRARLLEAAKKKYPNALFYGYDPLTSDNERLGAEIAFGPGARVVYDLSGAKVVFSLDADFLGERSWPLSMVTSFSKTRQIYSAAEAEKMSRLYMAEGALSSTGTAADHRVRVASSQMASLLKALAGELTKAGVAGLPEQGSAPAGSEKFVAALAKDLVASPGKAIVLVGEQQPAGVHAYAHAINVALGAYGADALGKVVAPAGAAKHEDSTAALAALVDGANKGLVETLIIVGANPVYTAPTALGVAAALKKIGTVVHAGLFRDETGVLAGWHLPLSHFLETWDDARGPDGLASVVQPLLSPLFGTRSSIELLAQLAGASSSKGRALVEETWRGAGGLLADEKAWRRALHNGVIAGSAFSAVAVPGVADVAGKALEAFKAVKESAPSESSLELVVVMGHALDGRLANVGWIQELPDDISQVCWDNVAYVSPALAKSAGIQSAVKKNAYWGDVVRLSVEGRSIELPSFVLPGLAPHTVVVARGYGRTQGGDIANGVGVDVAPILAAAGGSVIAGVKLERTGDVREVCSTQDHFSVEGKPIQQIATFTQGDRPIFRRGTLALYQEEANKPLGKKFAHQGDVPAELVEHEGGLDKRLSHTEDGPRKLKQLTHSFPYDGQQWGMVIDLTACSGCGVCTIACQAENNIPIVGREQVLKGREMHWIRVDRYFFGDVDQPEAVSQPVPCMQCENAPCEPVCPVAATVHDEEGLNAMAYNRCIGTRYCSNNCPYKVRRFNYLDFTKSGNLYVSEEDRKRQKTLKMQRNPNVTVRYRGVMEKCTYCTQRIQEAKFAAKRAGRDGKALPDGAVTPACAQACPSDAIVFGNINDPASRVAGLRQSDRNYEMLQELNVRPRTTYLAKLRNANKELT